VRAAPSAVASRLVMDAHELGAFRRRAAALAAHEIDDEGPEDVRAEVIAGADRWRAAHGIEPLRTEGELHRRARAPGLLG
jgi:hypothetical protein